MIPLELFELASRRRGYTMAPVGTVYTVSYNVWAIKRGSVVRYFRYYMGELHIAHWRKFC
jgi:hypothetical protein